LVCRTKKNLATLGSSDNPWSCRFIAGGIYLLRIATCGRKGSVRGGSGLFFGPGLGSGMVTRLDDCLRWAVFWENDKSKQLFGGNSFPQLRLSITFGNKWIGIHYGRFFHKLIWSPWAHTQGSHFLDLEIFT
jgi:hypothetical protein